MTGKTHLAVGVLTACAVTRPQSIPEIVLCVGTAAVGALISDVDVTHSNAKNRLDQIIGMIIGAVVLIAVINIVFGIDLYSRTSQKRLYHQQNIKYRSTDFVCTAAFLFSDR